MVDQHQGDPFADLFVDEQPLDATLLVEILKPFVKLDGRSGDIFTTSEWDRLGVQEKILIYLLGRKAIVASGRRADFEEEVSPSQIEEATELKGGSIRPALSKHLEEHLVRVRQEKGERERRYFVPHHVIPRVGEIVMRKIEGKNATA